MNNQIQIILKLVLSILLFVCLLDMPYGYYQLVRFVAMTVFSLFAFDSFSNKRHYEGILYVCLALLFQPFVKIALGRMMWNLVDVIVGTGLIVSIWWNVKRMNETK